MGAAVVFAERLDLFAAVGIQYQDTHQATGHFNPHLNRIGQTASTIGTQHYTVDNDFYGMLHLLVQDDGGVEIHYLPIHTHPNIATLLRILEYLLMFPFPSQYHRSEDHQPALLRVPVDRVQDLVDRLFGDLATTFGTERLADPSPKQPVVVVYFCYGTDNGPWIVVCGLLFDRNSWRKAFDIIDIRLFHPSEKLPRICRQGLDIPPLPFCKNGIEGQ